jgi:hypothetical protein
VREEWEKGGESEEGEGGGGGGRREGGEGGEGRKGGQGRRARKEEYVIRGLGMDHIRWCCMQVCT